ncbi:MAG: glutamate formimidoyltransferase [Bryobacterales bacterium]|nr:glutamate formimidoyltransferase [Acidobacteriota bacterium]MCB9383877.1 glutamate formimidoyltransferase [Bryobacterales bacterium]
MTPWVECVPNFSEGRDADVLAALRQAITGSAGVHLLDWSADEDHNRSVFTFVGPPREASEALFAAACVAAERIDLRRHQGQHPRIGALDVAPFIPLERLSWDAAIETAHAFGRRLWDELAIPVYFYARAALAPERERLENVRRGGFEGLRQEVLTDLARRPDVGGQALHPSAGATAVGARKLLVAFNVNLETRDPALARRIARSIRASSGGYPAVKALGLELPHAGLTQVSMNLTDYEVTSPSTVFARIEAEARAAGVSVAGSELIGLIPRAALKPLGAEGMRIQGFSPDRILDNRIRQARAG